MPSTVVLISEEVEIFDVLEVWVCAVVICIWPTRICILERPAVLAHVRGNHGNSYVERALRSHVSAESTRDLRMKSSSPFNFRVIRVLVAHAEKMDV
jgi:hypothetical protein